MNFCAPFLIDQSFEQHGTKEKAKEKDLLLSNEPETKIREQESPKGRYINSSAASIYIFNAICHAIFTRSSSLCNSCRYKKNYFCQSLNKQKWEKKGEI